MSYVFGMFNDANLSYFLAGIVTSTIFFVTPIVFKVFHRRSIKCVIDSNIVQLTKIYSRLHTDINEFDGTESDFTRMSDIKMYFERKFIMIEMIRINIQNQLTHMPSSWPLTDTYRSKVQVILDDLDVIIETCYNPSLPTKYHLSIWRNKKNMILSRIKHTIEITQDEINLNFV